MYEHRAKKSGTYRSWMAMRSRCLYPKNIMYSYYGGRGIKVCERWATYANFLADMGERPDGTTLDRIDNSGNYEPSNCRWASKKIQVENRRPNRKTVEWNGEFLTMKELAARAGMKRDTLVSRMRAGKSLDAALAEPVRRKVS